MAYATATEAIKDGELIYERGNVTAKRTSNGEYIYWPKQAGAAMDAAAPSAVGTPLPGSVIDRVVNGLMAEADNDDDDAAILAELRVGLMMPELKALASSVANDSKDEELRKGEVSGNEVADEDNTFGAGYEASLKATKEYWAKARSVKPSATYSRVRGRNNNKPVAVDHVANNARKARGYSMFDTAKAIIKRQRKASK